MNPDRVIVLCAYYRCGSTALCEHYSKKYNISNNDEMFFHDADPNQVIQTLEKNPKYVLKIMSDQWVKNTSNTHKEYIMDICAKDTTKIVLLYRKNIAESVLSIAHCNHTSVWHNKENTINNSEINILVQKALTKYTKEYITDIKYANQMLDYIRPAEVIEYEEIFKLPNQKFKKSISNNYYNQAQKQLAKQLTSQLVYDGKYFNII